MRSLLAKIENLYDLSNTTSKYAVENYTYIASLVIMNLVGIFLLILPVVALSFMAINTPFSEYSTEKITMNNFYFLAIAAWAYFSFTGIFFINNKAKISAHLLIFAHLMLGFGILAMCGEGMISLYKAHMVFFKEGQINPFVIYFDIMALISLATIMIYRNNKDKVQNFFNTHFASMEKTTSSEETSSILPGAEEIQETAPKQELPETKEKRKQKNQNKL